MINIWTQFCQSGFYQFAYDEKLAAWVEETKNTAITTLQNPKNTRWWRCGGTWFAGVSVLGNDHQGCTPSKNGKTSQPLQGKAIEFTRKNITKNIPLTQKNNQIAWDIGQVSVCTQNYPQIDKDNDTLATHQYRKKRFAAHIDGLLKRGREKKRYLCEQHAFILGIAMNDTSEKAAPFVVYEESHKYIGEFLRSNLKHHPPHKWQEIELTKAYHDIRNKIFATCHPRPLWVRPGEAFLVHRFALHGTKAWHKDATAEPINKIPARMLTFFRPQTTNPTAWLNAP